jgi:hypothetical protein
MRINIATRCGALLAVAVALAGCLAATDVDQDEPDGSEEIYYRGESRTAHRYGELLVLEGDITVTPSDLWGGPEGALAEHEDGEVALATSALRIQGANRRWPSGVVPFRFGNYNNSAGGGTLVGALSNAQQNTITAAMDVWEELVPGIDFRARVAGDANFVTFNLSTVCSSPLGRSAGDTELGGGALAGEQIIRLSAGCLGTFSVHHEIGHTLGVLHEHTRKDRGTFVQVNWANIIGCTNTATGGTAAQGCTQCATATTAAQAAACGCTLAQVNNNSCNSFLNFTSNNARADIGDYDYGSVMHYPVAAFSKGGSTLTALQATTSTIGQRTRLSERDSLVVNTMYPRLHVQGSAFEDTGNIPLCVLAGREQDRQGTSFTLPSSAFPSSAITAGVLDTSRVSTGTYSLDCRARSTYWSGNYDYPNTSTSFDTTQPAANVETYDAATLNVTILPQGLIAAIFRL